MPMKIRRQFTVDGKDAYDGIAFRKATSEIRNPDGSIVFRNDRVEAPEDWSQVAIDILAQKYFRKAGVATAADLEPVVEPVAEKDVPSWLARHTPRKDAKTGGETSARQVFDRLAGDLDLLGLEGRLFRRRGRRARLLRRDALHAGAPDGGAELAAMVQHRPALGLWHRRARPGPPLCRPRIRAH